jgi:hypothetical protein
MGKRVIVKTALENFLATPLSLVMSVGMFTHPLDLRGIILLPRRTSNRDRPGHIAEGDD